MAVSSKSRGESPRAFHKPGRDDGDRDRQDRLVDDRGRASSSRLELVEWTGKLDNFSRVFLFRRQFTGVGEIRIFFKRS
ncbi:unnamed protein product [Ectocarpus sp. CCAP 1310/34]|nr:unnamed protein product [Ectocarpus sp. CCAP 1310/34]